MSDAPDETTEGPGKGPEGTVPDNEKGIGLTTDENATGFEPEEESPIVFLRLRKAARKLEKQRREAALRHPHDPGFGQGFPDLPPPPRAKPSGCSSWCMAIRNTCPVAASNRVSTGPRTRPVPRRRDAPRAGGRRPRAQ